MDVISLTLKQAEDLWHIVAQESNPYECGELVMQKNEFSLPPNFILFIDGKEWAEFDFHINEQSLYVLYGRGLFLKWDYSKREDGERQYELDYKNCHYNDAIFSEEQVNRIIKNADRLNFIQYLFFTLQYFFRFYRKEVFIEKGTPITGRQSE